MSKRNPRKAEMRNIVFDLGNIIVDVRYERLAKVMSIPIEEFNTIYQHPNFRDFETGKMSANEYFQFLAENSSFDLSQQARYQAAIMVTFPLRLRTWGLLHFLRRRFSLYLLSNTNPVDFEGIDRAYGMRPRFDHCFLSYEQGLMKPDPAIYQKATELWRIKASQTIFFDDRKENIDAANAFGWKAFHIQHETQMINELVENGCFSALEVSY
ncbi:MAG TPA: HAD family phosphatase [Candidatus Marinimicrobia bacterium]|nr:HAD family phosphatase [Candidatus Neomarinimicrobiota bacterium]